MSDAYLSRATAACTKADTPARVAIIVYSTLEEITEMALPYDARLTSMRRVLELATARGVDPFDTAYDYDKGMFLADVLYQWKELPGNRDILRLMVEVGLDPSTPIPCQGRDDVPLVLAAALVGNEEASAILRASPKYRPTPSATAYIALLEHLV